jgi:hypothetical protein
MLRRLLFSCTFLLLLRTPAYAITITGGSLQIGTSNFGSLTLLGNNFTFSSGVFDAPGVFACETCLPGPQVGANDGHVFLSGDDLVPSGPGPTASLFFTLVNPWIVPAQITRPFTFVGSLNGDALDGVGLATLQLTGNTDLFERTGLLYQFTVPEPSTWLLLCTGFVGLAFARSKAWWDRSADGKSERLIVRQLIG